MKSFTMRSVFAVAALAVAAVSASAQTYNAEIPVAFHFGDALLAPGSYQLVVVNHGTGLSHATISVRNLHTGNSALALSSPGSDAPKSWKAAGTPMIALECLRGNCALRSLWNGQDPGTIQFPGLKMRPVDSERMASLTIALTKGD